MPMASEVGLHLSPDGQDLLPFLVTEPHGSLKAGPKCSLQLFAFPKGWLESSPVGFIALAHRLTPVNRQLDLLLSFGLV